MSYSKTDPLKKDFVEDQFFNTYQVFFDAVLSWNPQQKCENKIFLCRQSLNPNESTNLATELSKAEMDEENETGCADSFLTGLVDILCNIPVNEITMTLHLETIRVVIALLSSQLYEESVTEKSLFLKYLMRMRAPNQRTDSKSESLVISLASSMWSALQKTVMIPSDEVDEELEADRFPPQSLGSLSSGLLLSIVCFPSFDERQNPYAEKIALFQNAQEVSSLANLEASFKLDFTALYNRLCESVGDKLSMLLLYMLLHKNTGFRNFILSRINLENLVVPIIKVLNDGVCQPSFRSHSHQTYLALIVLLILSEDDFFCKIIHETKLKNVTWYQPERPISEISLGGLIVLVFIKTIHTNTIKTRDRYLHTNSLAALANMSSCFKLCVHLFVRNLLVFWRQ
uniref:Dymeclin n=1 Tax=Ditylenchus dipsaci TaxID=166011 RepID=A0A915EJA8_9BILA